MSHCKDCRYWRPGDGFDVRENRGKCVRFWESNWKLPEDEVARPPSSSGGHGEGRSDVGVVTGPLFGCIKFEPKVGQTTSQAIAGDRVEQGTCAGISSG